MYVPRPARLHAIAALLAWPFPSVMSPRAPGRTAYSGFSGLRPLVTMMTPPPMTGVGAVIFELPPSRHSSAPVRTSYPRMNVEPFVTSSGPDAAVTTVGVPHDGSSSRAVFHTVSPVRASSASTKASVWVSHCSNTRSFEMMGELAGPHSYDGMSYAPMSTRPRSTDHRGRPATS